MSIFFRKRSLNYEAQMIILFLTIWKIIPKNCSTPLDSESLYGVFFRPYYSTVEISAWSPYYSTMEISEWSPYYSTMEISAWCPYFSTMEISVWSTYYSTMEIYERKILKKNVILRQKKDKQSYVRVFSVQETPKIRFFKMS